MLKKGTVGRLFLCGALVACGNSDKGGATTNTGGSGNGGNTGGRWGGGASGSGATTAMGGRASTAGSDGTGGDLSAGGAQNDAGGGGAVGGGAHAGSAGMSGGSNTGGASAGSPSAGGSSAGRAGAGGLIGNAGAPSSGGAGGMGAPGDFCPSRWCWAQPLPQGTGAVALWVVADDDVWMGGEAGTFARWNGAKWLYYTVDAQSNQSVISIWGSAANDLWATNGSELFRFDGTAWRKVASPMSTSGVAYTYQISGSGPSDVWFATHDGLFHWTGSAFEAAVMPALKINWVQVASPKEAWAISNDNQLFQWNGSAWSSLSFPNASPMFEGLWAAGPKNMWLVDTGAAWHWDGAMFKMSPTLVTGTGYLYYQNFFGAGQNDVWLTTPAGVQHVVGDKAPVVPFDATGAAVPLAGMASPNGALWVAGQYGRVWRLQNDHFALAVPPLVAQTVGDLRGVWSDGKGMTLAVGNDWIQNTGNGWQRSTIGAGVVEADAVWGRAANDAWAVGAYATVNHFDGNGWTTVDAGVPSAAKSKLHLYAVSGTEQGEMWAIGQGGQFVHFDGMSYEVGTTASVADMRALWVRTPDDVWAAGQSGVVQRWTRGSGWAKIAATPSTTLNGLWGRSATDVWAVASTSGIYHYDGNSWSAVPGPTNGASQVLNAITGTADGELWAVGAAGIILHYASGAWQQEATRVPNKLLAVTLGSAGEVWTVGEREYVLRRSP